MKSQSSIQNTRSNWRKARTIRATSKREADAVCTLAMLLMLFTLSGCSPSIPEVVVGDTAPSFEATALDGSTISFPDVTGDQASVVLMWATWCPYCTAFMPHLAEIQAEYADRGVNIVAINAKERGRGDPRAYMRDNGYEFITILEGDDIAESWDVDYLPGLFVVDGHGEIIFRREWTDLPAGQKVSDLWAGQVRAALNARR